MIPVSAEWNAATQDSAGSIRTAAPASSMVTFSTPLASAWA